MIATSFVEKEKENEVCFNYEANLILDIDSFEFDSACCTLETYEVCIVDAYGSYVSTIHKKLCKRKCCLCIVFKEGCNQDVLLQNGNYKFHILHPIDNSILLTSKVIVGV